VEERAEGEVDEPLRGVAALEALNPALVVGDLTVQRQPWQQSRTEERAHARAGTVGFAVDVLVAVDTDERHRGESGRHGLDLDLRLRRRGGQADGEKPNAEAEGA
jgi:hypothetical protein